MFNKLACAVLSRVQLFETPWSVAYQVPLSMDFQDKNTRVGCHFLLQRLFPAQESKLCLLSLLHWQAGSLPSEPREAL